MKYRSLVFAFLSAALLVSCGKDNPTPAPQPEPGGGGSQPSLILSQDFTKGLGSFTKGGPNKDIWVFDSNNKKYGAQATGKDVKTPVESWLLSPEIDLTNYKTDVYLYFNHAFARVDAGEPSDYFSVAVSDNNGTTWTSRDVPKWLVSYSYYELAQSGNIALGAFKGKKIQIALIYKSKEVEVEGKKQLIHPPGKSQTSPSPRSARPSFPTMPETSTRAFPAGWNCPRSRTHRPGMLILPSFASTA